MRSLCKSSWITQSWFLRSISISSTSCYATSAKNKPTTTNDAKTRKQILLKLRKNTGFPLSKCKQALLKYDYDFEEALDEMKKNAEKEGWSKMSTLSGRDTSQGLVTAQKSGKYATLLEINCESDFVAKTKEFQSFVGVISQTVLDHFSKENTEKVNLTSEEILSLSIPSKNHTVNDALASVIGKVKENIKISRGVVTSVADSDNEFIGIYTHPDLQTPHKGGRLPLMGRYAALVGMRTKAQEPQGPGWLLTKARDLAQHVVGMNPSVIGKKHTTQSTAIEDTNTISIKTADTATASSSSEPQSQTEASQTEDEESDFEEDYFNNELSQLQAYDSDQLLHQPFLLDPNITIQNWLDINRLEVMYFVRYQIGELKQSEVD